jgi:soluble lytic murein transglycosylase
VMRIARNDPLLAMSYWDAKVRAQFPAEDNAWLLTQVATIAARKLMPEAVAWFAQAEAADAAMGLALNDEQQAWRARIAMRQDNWSEVRSAIERMSTQARNDPAWIYWMGRALRATAGASPAAQPPVALNAPPNAQQLARAQFARIAGDYSYYGRLAAEELGQPMQLPPPAAGASADEMAAAAANPGLRRALALYRLDMRTEGTREWAWAIRGMDDRSLLAAAELARRNELWDRAINTADRTIASHDFNLRYLAPYRDILASAAKARAIEEPLVLGLVRQESRFISGAKSGVGASGLMQLMPATARWIAHKLGIKDYSWARVHEPAVNAQLGTAYLRQVLDDLDGFPVLAAAAYNAGPGRARKWRDTRPLEGAVYVESIPFNETRDYVKKVMANTVFYAAVLGGEPVSLKARLGIIAARSGADRLAALKDDPTP